MINCVLVDKLFLCNFLACLLDRIQSLETALKSCQKELKDEKAKLGELKEHFKYNLKLINDRDAELQRYDALFLGNLQHLLLYNYLHISLIQELVLFFKKMFVSLWN